MEMYKEYVRVLKKLDGKEGRRDWRAELAESLTQWHDTFKTVTKTNRDPTAHMTLSPGQVNVEVDAHLL